MTDVIIIDSDGSLASLAVKALTNFYFVDFRTDSSNFGCSCKHIIIRCKSAAQSSEKENVVIVLGENISKIPKLAAKATAIIANAANKEQMNALSYATGNVIACGNLIMDTVSYTSISDEEVCVSFGRELTGLYGNSIQPFEIPVARTAKDSVYAIMAVTALRVILEDDEIAKNLYG